MLTRILYAPDAAGGGATVAPKPAVAAAAPAAPSTPAPAPNASPEPNQGPSDPFSDLDASMNPPTEGKKADAPPKDLAEPAPEPKVEDKTVKTKDERTIQAPKALREENERKGGVIKDLEKKHSEALQKIAEYESKGKDTEQLIERVKLLEKQIEEKDTTIRAVKFEASPEFKEKYEKPFNDSADYAREQISQMEVTDPETNTVRPANWDTDFAAIYQLPVGKAFATAKELFGDASSLVMQHYHELHKRDRERGKALEGEKEVAKQRENEAIQNRSKTQEAYRNAWTKVNADIISKRPEHFQEDPTDTEGNDLLKKSYATVDSAFGESRQKLTAEQQIVLDANIRHRAAAFPREVLRNSRLKSELATVKAELEKYRNGGPKIEGQRSEGGAAGGEKEETLADTDFNQFKE